MNMPTTVYKICTTRPNTDSLFNFELCSNNDYLVQDDNTINQSIKSFITVLESELYTQPSKVRFYRYEEFITWNEILQKKEDIRPDIRYRLDKLGLFDMNYINFGHGPKFNFLSLTHTERTEFESFDHWEIFYNYSRPSLEEKKSYNKLCSNTVKEEIFINGENCLYDRFVFN